MLYFPLIITNQLIYFQNTTLMSSGPDLLTNVSDSRQEVEQFMRQINETDQELRGEELIH